MKNKGLAVSAWITLALVAASLEPIFIKFGYRDSISPLQLLFLKNIIGAILIIPLARRWKWIGQSGLMHMALAGTLLFTTNFLIFQSLQHLAVVLLITIITTTPALVALANSILGRDKLSGSFWIGFILCFAGVIMTLNFNDLAINVGGIACAFGAAISSTFYRVKMEGLTAKYSPALSSIYTFLVQGTLTLGFLPWMNGIPLKAVGLGVWIGLSSAVANIAFLSALNMVGSTRISVLTMLQRPLVIIFAAVALHESATPVQIVGIILVTIGVQLAKVHRLEQPSAPEPQPHVA